jgi:hypothetical protein
MKRGCLLAPSFAFYLLINYPSFLENLHARPNGFGTRGP